MNPSEADIIKVHTFTPLRIPIPSRGVYRPVVVDVAREEVGRAGSAGGGGRGFEGEHVSVVRVM